MQTSGRNNAGFTLVEILVAMLITTVAMLGLLQSVNIMTAHNLRNALREEALVIAERKMSEIRATSVSQIPRPDPFATGTPCSYPEETEPCRLRGTTAQFTVNKTAEWKSDTAAIVTVQVSMNYQNSTIRQALSTVVSLGQ